MGYLRPTAIIVTGLYPDEGGRHWGVVAHDRALEVFFEMSQLVSELAPEMFGARTFVVFWDGSREEFAASKRADVACAEFVSWLKDQTNEDGLSPLRWVELAYCDDNGDTRVMATSADVLNAARANLNKIRLEIEEPLKTAFEWAEGDGIVILDPDGWCEPVEELPPLGLMVPIGRGEFERRLEVSQFVRVQ